MPVIGPRVRCAALLLVGAAVSPAYAHDIPNERVDRSIQVLLQPARLVVHYEVSLAELTLVQDLKSLIEDEPVGDRRQLFDRYARETGPLNARGFQVVLNGLPLALSCASGTWTAEEHPTFQFVLVAPIPPAGRLRLRDENYIASLGTSRLALRAESAVAVHGYDGPGDVASVPVKPTWMLSDEEERQTREVSVEYRWVGAASAVAPAQPTPAPPVRGPTPQPPSGRLVRLLDRASRVHAIGLVLIAYALGLAHGVQPGHGKTLVAAASLGEAGSWSRGLFLALVTIVAHTGLVVILAVVLWSVRVTSYGVIQSALLGVTGFMVAAVGLWRMGRHLAGHGEHGPIDSGSHPGADSLPLRRLVGLGFAGGLVPCWDAVLLLVVATAIGRTGLGLALLLGFNLGMGTVLVAVGLVASRLRRLVRAPAGSPWERRLGVASGLVLAAIGLAFLANA